ncbi:MAG: nucleotidyltransferase family protein [Deltaproteobacteria bacterium]|nr:nucleotidyltransferase family protein [Deltaproteobacteria bacterium]
MKKIDEYIKILRVHKTELKEKFRVESLAVFGSVRWGVEGPGSDVDILVRYYETPGLFKFLDLKKYLENIVNSPVDLVTEQALKKQLREKIIKEAVRVA